MATVREWFRAARPGAEQTLTPAGWEVVKHLGRAIDARERIERNRATGTSHQAMVNTLMAINHQNADAGKRQGDLQQALLDRKLLEADKLAAEEHAARAILIAIGHQAGKFTFAFSVFTSGFAEATKLLVRYPKPAGTGLIRADTPCSTDGTKGK